jgi:hypothetical protein
VQVREPAYDSDIRDGAWVADLTGLLDLSGWPAGMQVIVRKELPIAARNCGSPTPTGTASPRSPPTPPAGSSPYWNYVTAAGPLRRPHPQRERYRADQPAVAHHQISAPSSPLPAKVTQSGRKRALHLPASGKYSQLLLNMLNQAAEPTRARRRTRQPPRI